MKTFEKGKLLTLDAMQKRIADRIEGGSPPSLFYIRTHIPREKKLRVGRAVMMWEVDFEKWVSGAFERSA